MGSLQPANQDDQTYGRAWPGESRTVCQSVTALAARIVEVEMLLISGLSLTSQAQSRSQTPGRNSNSPITFALGDGPRGDGTTKNYIITGV